MHKNWLSKEVSNMSSLNVDVQAATVKTHKDPMPEAPELTPGDYFRMPWSLTDNGISWLEVTDACNLACEGCYRPHKENHKTLEQIAEELAVFKRQP